MEPTQTVTKTVKKNMTDIEFPVVFKICIKPGFNETVLNEVGYSNTWDYFVGKSRYNWSLRGWAGHSVDGGIVSNVTGTESQFSKL